MNDSASNLRVLIVCAVSSPEQAKDDKESMGAQERDGVAWADAAGATIVDIVRIPGFSRSYLTLQELVDAANAAGEHGPETLQRHLTDCDFDVMWVRATNRFGREQSLNSEVITRVVKLCGAAIQSQMDGRIDSTNFRPMSAITGYRDAIELDEFKRKRVVGMIGRAKRGLPISGRPPKSHRMIYDPQTGKELRMEVRAELLPLWRDAITLLVEGVASDRLEEALLTRFGYTQKNGSPLPTGTIYRLFWNPLFWGNNIIRWQGKSARYGWGMWVFDDSAPLPAGTDAFYNTHPPVLTGDLADTLKAELRRRAEVYNGTHGKYGTRAFSTLILCDECHRRYGYFVDRRNRVEIPYMRCVHAARRRLGVMGCSQKKAVKEGVLRDFMTMHLAGWLESGQVVFASTPDTTGRRLEIKQLTTAVQTLQRRLDGLILNLADADADLRVDFQRQMRSTKDELNRAKAQLDDLERVERRASKSDETQRAQLDIIRKLTIPGFWQRDGLFVNQVLKAMLGTYRIVVSDGKPTHFVDKADLNLYHKNR